LGEAWKFLREGQKDLELMFYLAEKTRINPGVLDLLFENNDPISQSSFASKMVELAYNKSLYLVLEIMLVSNPDLVAEHADGLLNLAIKYGQFESVKTLMDVLDDDLDLSQPNA